MADDKDKYADGDGVASKCGRAENTDDADKADPTGVRDGELQNAGERNAHQPEQHREVQANLFAQDANALGAAKQAIELIEDADAAAGEGCERGASDAEFMKWPDAENEARVENEIDDVGDPEQTHGDGRIAGTAKMALFRKRRKWRRLPPSAMRA